MELYITAIVYKNAAYIRRVISNILLASALTAGVIDGVFAGQEYLRYRDYRVAVGEQRLDYPWQCLRSVLRGCTRLSTRSLISDALMSFQSRLSTSHCIAVMPMLLTAEMTWSSYSP